MALDLPLSLHMNTHAHRAHNSARHLAKALAPSGSVWGCGGHGNSSPAHPAKDGGRCGPGGRRRPRCPQAAVQRFRVLTGKAENSAARQLVPTGQARAPPSWRALVAGYSAVPHDNKSCRESSFECQRGAQQQNAGLRHGRLFRPLRSRDCVPPERKRMVFFVSKMSQNQKRRIFPSETCQPISEKGSRNERTEKSPSPGDTVLI